MNNNYQVPSIQPVNKIQNYFIVFTIKDKQYAINVENIVEIIKLPAIEVPENTPVGIVGFFNYKDKIIKVVDLCPILGFESSEFSINNQLIIIGFNDEYLAIHTEKIINIKELEAEYIKHIPVESDLSVLKEIYYKDDDLIHIVNIEHIYKIIENNTNNEKRVNNSYLLPQDEKSLQILKVRNLQNKYQEELFSFPIDYSGINQYILFTLGDYNYYLDLKYVKEFVSLKRLNITKLPYTQDYIKGLINIKGDFLIVIDLKRFLNNEKNNIEKGSKLIITQGKNFNLALLVDDIKYIKNIENKQKTNNINNNSEYIISEFMENENLYSILNYEKIINDEKIYINIT